MHGYQLIQEIARRSDGVWRPSAGSVYPALSLLEDEGLVRPDVRPEDEGGRKVFALTDAGRAYVTEHAGELAAPWDAVTGGVSDAMADLMGLIREVHFAAVQVLRTGDAQRVAQAHAVLAETTRSLYLVLAGEPGDEARRLLTCPWPSSGTESGQLDGQGHREGRVEDRRAGHPGRPQPVGRPPAIRRYATAASVASDADSRTASKCQGVSSRPIPAGTVACTIIEPEMLAMASRVLPCLAQITALSTSGSSVATGASSSATAAGGRPERGAGPLQLLDEQLRGEDDHHQRDPSVWATTAQRGGAAVPRHRRSASRSSAECAGSSPDSSRRT